MKIIDTNVLLFAVNEEAAQHRAARAWLEAALNGREPVGFAWIVIVAFLRVGTLSGAFRVPLSAAEALDNVHAWLSARPSVVVHPTVRHFDILRGLIEPLGTAANLVNDAHLAALAV